jgi:hypothetical protein
MNTTQLNIETVPTVGYILDVFQCLRAQIDINSPSQLVEYTMLQYAYI